jgi:hypothetical protein
MLRRLFITTCAGLALLAAIDGRVCAQEPLSLQYVVPQNGSPAPDPSLIDARLDDGTDDTDQGFQTYDDFNDHFLNGTMYSSTIDGRTVLRRKPEGGNNQAGLRTNGNMTTSSAFGSMPHGSNANTWNGDATVAITSSGFRGSMKIWLPDVPDTGPPQEFHGGIAAQDRFAWNSASFNATTEFDLTGFGVRTNADGEMVLFPHVLWTDYSADPSLYEYVIPDLAANDGTVNNLHIIDMIVGGPSASAANEVDFYVDGVAVPNLTDLLMTAPAFSYGAVQFGDCCGSVPLVSPPEVEWAIEWMKVEEGVFTPHPAPEPPTGNTGDYNGNGVVDAADYVVWRENVGTNNTLANNSLPGPIGTEHFNQWKANFGDTTGAGSLAGVPEPNCLLLLAIAGLLMATGRYR